MTAGVGQKLRARLAQRTTAAQLQPPGASAKQAGVERHARESAAAMRATLEHGAADAATFRTALSAVSALDRDAWADRALGLPEPPEDGHELPRGCVPYLPCSVDTLLRAVDAAPITASDVFVDVGSGLGRATTLVHLVTGATAIGLEIQPALVASSRALCARLRLAAVTTIEGDASSLLASLARFSVLFLYCPFSGERLSRFLDELEPLARSAPLRVCCVDMAELERGWLRPSAAPAENLRIYRSTKRA